MSPEATRGYCLAVRSALTDDGRRLFPDRHGELTVQLVHAIRDALGEDGLTRVIDARTDEQLRAYRAVLGHPYPIRGTAHDRCDLVDIEATENPQQDNLGLIGR